MQKRLTFLASFLALVTFFVVTGFFVVASFLVTAGAFFGAAADFFTPLSTGALVLLVVAFFVGAVLTVSVAFFAVVALLDGGLVFCTSVNNTPHTIWVDLPLWHQQRPWDA